MQVLHKKRKPWSPQEKKIALSLYYKSPSTYNYMRKSGIILPGKSTVKRWLNSIHFSTGFPSMYMEQIKLKTSDFTYEEKKCVILLDEVSIMKSIEYNKILDEIEGFEDLGPLGRTPTFGTHALVIMLRGLYKKWKFPFCYFFTGNGVKGDDLVIIIKKCVEKVMTRLNLIPTTIVCDQGTQNQRMFKLLGGTEDRPFTIINEKKIFLIYDMPHLVKSIRNNLLSGNFEINNNIVSFKDIRKTYETDIKNTARAMTKITPAHLAPNAFQKMTCKLAIQLFSNSVSAAIKTCVSTGELISDTAINTSNFISVINDMFDAANSKNLYDRNINKRPISDNNTHVLQNLEKARLMFKNAKKINLKTNKTSVPPCFTGIIWSTTAIMNLFQSEKEDMSQFQPTGKDYFLMTNRLTQDALENFFSLMRQKNGYNRNPTARTFRCCFGHICTYSLMQCSTCCSNCEDDDDNYLTTADVENVTVVPGPVVVEDLNETLESVSSFSETSGSPKTTFEATPISLETCSITYFAGYLAKKCIQKFNCEMCKLNLITKTNKNDENQLLLHNKTYDYTDQGYGLKAPTNILLDISTICLNVFKNNFDEMKCNKKLLAQLISKAETKIEDKYSILQSNSCKEHFQYIIELLLRTKLYKECKWLNANSGKRSMQNADKLRVLQNI
ncbi:unnamed protein product [Macrosiphum euphorbiae]|nr:unnamed protein product [Macrosiphum euphorbiae]CAI6353730.1 unnamed protein product [Macrosiphum euphorbiae]CAI6361340.1 unnamed protein product [Macrosiphum euphorbiae]CAI6377087.1 unnamed protein product [Macrosiphum euphorbiae]